MNITIFISALALVFSHALSSFGYETIGFKNGGSVEGTVEFAGDTIPKDETFTISSDVKYCGKELRTEKYLINEGKKIKNVVVYLKDIRAGKAISSEETVTISDSKCTFVPHVSIGFTGNKYIVKNEDPILHTIHVYARVRGKTIFNSALPERGSSLMKTFTRTGVMEFNCDCHPWMESFIVVFDHPYAAMTDEQGRFLIKDIPPGTYTVEAWHEALGTAKISDVTVKSMKTSTLKLKYTNEMNIR